jgi:hypothetical protein
VTRKAWALAACLAVAVWTLLGAWSLEWAASFGAGGVFLIEVVVYFASLAALATSGCVGSMYLRIWQEARAQRRGDAVAESLEEYRRRTGRYPSSLSELAGSGYAVPLTGLGAFTDEPFMYWSREDSYLLRHSASGFGVCERTSQSAWQCVD